jgi:hypothetical protein
MSDIRHSQMMPIRSAAELRSATQGRRKGVAASNIPVCARQLRVVHSNNLERIKPPRLAASSAS